MTGLDDAWQATLAAEHQAVFGYGLLGPRVGGSDRQLARECEDAHVALRDATAAAQAGGGIDPVSARADYPSLYPVTDPASARLLAVRLEQDCCVAWRVLYLESASVRDGIASITMIAAGLRTSAQAALTAAAVRATRWRAAIAPAQATTAFPGI